MHVVDGIGDVKGLVRENIPRRNGYDKLAKLAGPGETPYTRYDRDIAAQAQIWLHEQAAARSASKPWALFVSFVCPHFPLTAPPEFYYRYPHDRIALPKQYALGRAPGPPVPARLRRLRRLRPGLRRRSMARVRRAIAGYMGLVSFMDHQVGMVLRALRGRRPRAATPAWSTPATMATTSARAACGASRRCTKSRPACR